MNGYTEHKVQEAFWTESNQALVCLTARHK
jgi:hypothetical protein